MNLMLFPGATSITRTVSGTVGFVLLGPLTGEATLNNPLAFQDFAFNILANRQQSVGIPGLPL